MTDKIAKSDILQTRPGEFDDLAFIYATWLKGLRWGSDYHRAIDQDAYFKGQHKVIETILHNPETIINVMCLKDAPEVIEAYAVYTKGGILHWVHVKKDWRRQGLAKDLIPNNITAVSNYTRVGLSILKNHPGVIINPYTGVY